MHLTEPISVIKLSYVTEEGSVILTVLNVTFEKSYVTDGHSTNTAQFELSYVTERPQLCNRIGASL